MVFNQIKKSLHRFEHRLEQRFWDNNWNRFTHQDFNAERVEQGIIFTNCTKQYLKTYENTTLINLYEQVEGQPMPNKTHYSGPLSNCYRRHLSIGDLLDNFHMLDPLPVTDFRVCFTSLFSFITFY